MTGRELKLRDTLVLAAVLEVAMIMLGAGSGASVTILVLLLASLLLTLLLAFYAWRAGL
ncbi:MAG: hypothetical protein GXO09_00200 [Crenarchaeota archaeon]|nr:hypothetical protein [Thermoproteota archaeon]